MFKRIGRSRAAQHAAGSAIAAYLKLVHSTSRFTIEPHDIHERVAAEPSVIWTVWHGEHLLVGYFRAPDHKAMALISRHRDGEINAQAARRMGVEAIRGSGDTKGRGGRGKGGSTAFRIMARALEDGTSIVMTADVPKIARRAGLGVVKLAARSGRPIIPLGVATSRYIACNTWDRMALHLPFSRGAVVCADWLRVAADADDAALEAARIEVETRLNAASASAREIAGMRHG